MSKTRARMAQRTVGGHAVKINGDLINIYFARIAYRCAECFGELEIVGAGVKCSKDHYHKGFIKKQEAQKAKNETQEQISEFYEIKNGVIVPKGE